MSLIKNSSGKQESNHTSISTKLVEDVNESQDQLKFLLRALDSIKIIKPAKTSPERAQILRNAFEDLDFSNMAGGIDVTKVLMNDKVFSSDHLTELLEIAANTANYVKIQEDDLLNTVAQYQLTKQNGGTGNRSMVTYTQDRQDAVILDWKFLYAIASLAAGFACLMIAQDQIKELGVMMNVDLGADSLISLFTNPSDSILNITKILRLWLLKLWRPRSTRVSFYKLVAMVK